MNEVIGFGAVIVSIFAGMLFNNGRFGLIDARLDQMERDLTKRIDEVRGELSGRIDRVQSDLRGRIDQVQADLIGRIDRVQTELGGRIDRVQADLSQFYMDLGRHDAKIEGLEKKAS